MTQSALICIKIFKRYRFVEQDTFRSNMAQLLLHLRYNALLQPSNSSTMGGVTSAVFVRGCHATSPFLNKSRVCDGYWQTSGVASPVTRSFAQKEKFCDIL
jgi:hypothetical protein